MDVKDITQRYALLREELRRRMSVTGKWHGVPGLLDELHSLRCAYNTALEESGVGG
jgi:hypothetical protein